MNDQQEHKLWSELGAIKKWLEVLDRKIDKQNSKVADIQKKVQAHEVFIGKIGAITAMLAFFASIVFAALINALLKFWK